MGTNKCHRTYRFMPRGTRFPHLLKIWVFFILIALASALPSAFAECLNISEVPYETTALSAPPNIMIVLDNSGSMDWEFLTDDDRGKFEGEIEYLFDDPGDNNYKVDVDDGDILSGAARAK